MHGDVAAPKQPEIAAQNRTRAAYVIATMGSPSCAAVKKASAAQNGLLTPGPRITGGFRSLPARLAPLFAEKAVEEILCRSRHAVLREQRMHPTFHITQR